MSFCNIGCPIHHLQRSTVRLPETHITRSVFLPISLRCCLRCRQVPKCEQMVDYVPICEHTARVKCWLKQAYQRSSAAQFVCPVKQDIKLPRCSHAAKATEVHPGLEREDAATVPYVEVFKDPLCRTPRHLIFMDFGNCPCQRMCPEVSCAENIQLQSWQGGRGAAGIGNCKWRSPIMGFCDLSHKRP